MKSGMPEDAEDEIGTLAEASKAPIDPGVEIADTGGQRIAPVLLDIAVAPLLAIQLGGVGRKPVHLDFGMGLHICFDHLISMQSCPWVKALYGRAKWQLYQHFTGPGLTTSAGSGGTPVD